MFRYAALALPLMPALCLAAEEATAPTTHQEFIGSLLDFLPQTELCLASCTDAAATEAALPRLHELAAQARQLSAWQQALPEPTVQDYMAAHPHVAEFNKLWEAIGQPLSRMEREKLITPELRELLQLAPPQG